MSERPAVTLPELHLRAGAGPLEPEMALACRVGLAAANLLHRVSIDRLSIEELAPALDRLDAGTLLAEVWDGLGRAHRGMAGLSIFQLVDSLAELLPYQLRGYGLTSLAEDHKELLQILRRLGVRI